MIRGKRKFNERKGRRPADFYYSGGPAPTTARGKRRHAARSEGARKHAEAVWSNNKVYVK